MNWPDTFEQAAERLLQRIESGFVLLSSPPAHFEEDEEHREFRVAAAAGARAYAQVLEEYREQSRLTNFELEKADLVATAAQSAGWLGTNGAASHRGSAVAALVADGVFVYHPAVPGQYVACHRLAAPR